MPRWSRSARKPPIAMGRQRWPDCIGSSGRTCPATAPTRTRLNIAVLLDHLNFFGRGYEGQLRDALFKRCRASGHNLVLVYGGALDEPTVLSSADNVIFEVIRPEDFDGIIVASALLSTYCGADGVMRLVERYARARLCSVGTAIPGVPSLILDNRSGDGSGRRAPRPPSRLPPSRLPRGDAAEPGSGGALRGLPRRARTPRHPVRRGARRERTVPSGAGTPRDGSRSWTAACGSTRSSQRTTAWRSARSRRSASGACGFPKTSA